VAQGKAIGGLIYDHGGESSAGSSVTDNADRIDDRVTPCSHDLSACTSTGMSMSMGMDLWVLDEGLSSALCSLPQLHTSVSTADDNGDTAIQEYQWSEIQTHSHPIHV